MDQAFSSFTLNSLNEPQKQAVTHDQGAVLVIAGAGSGKTRVITSRITYLIVEKKVPASAIIGLTFTNKAATEMKERIASFLGTQNPLPFVGTFHSYCVQFLKKYNHYLPTPFVSILDSDDQQKLLQSLLTKSNLNKQFSAKNVALHISQQKNNLGRADNNNGYAPHPLLNEIATAYEHEKKVCKALDFDDLLVETLNLLRNNPLIKEQFQNTVRHVLVDEYQDTNIVQHELLKQMALKNNHLVIDSVCAVGDEDQSIYSWRGATVTNIADFKKTFPHTQVITIEQNYRSSQQILHLANKAIEHNTHRTPKKLWSEKKGTNRIQALECLTEYQEARTIAQLLLTAQDKYPLNTVGILYRTHTQSRALEEALLKESIPYRIVGGLQFYERKEIKDLLAYLKIIANPFDRVSFFRIINTPARGLGNKFEEEFYELWNQFDDFTWYDVARLMIENNALNASKKEQVSQFLTLGTSFTAQDLPSKTIETIIYHINYISYLTENNDKQEAQARLDNIKELIEATKHFENNGIATITAFLEEVALMQEQMNKQNRDAKAVSLMTLHAAKGLEFSLVILPGIEEGIIPSTRSLNELETTEEERRLFYVGITRAKEHLLITRAKNRYSYGTMIEQSESRFLREVHDLIPLQQATYWNMPQTATFFAQWLGVEPKQTASIYVPSYNNNNSEKPKTFQSAGNSTTLKNSAWKTNQTVKHAEYGVGIVQNVEERSGGVTYLTVRFKMSTKKILSNFLHKI